MKIFNIKKTNAEITKVPIKCGNKNCNQRFLGNYEKSISENSNKNKTWYNFVCSECGKYVKVDKESVDNYQLKQKLWKEINKFNKKKQKEINKLWDKYNANQFKDSKLNDYYLSQFDEINLLKQKDNLIKQNNLSKKQIEELEDLYNKAKFEKENLIAEYNLSKNITELQDELDFLESEVSEKKDELKVIKKLRKGF